MIVRLVSIVFLPLILMGLPPAVQSDAHGAQKAVLITGASSGIGRMAAERLARAGYFVYAGARKQADMDALNAIANVKAVRLDVTVQEEIDAAVDLVRKEGRGLWGLVNNAGVNLIEPLIEVDDSTMEFIFDVNVYGVIRVTRAFAPLIIESKGRIVNISSIAGVLSGGLTGYGLYVMSKHAVEAFTDQLAWELAGFGVKVSAVEPGNFSSRIGLSRCARMLKHRDKRSYRYFQEQMNQYFEDCETRMADPEKTYGPEPVPVAAAIEHALFDESPKEHYLVVGDPFEAQITIGKLLEELVHMNHDHDHSFKREELIEMLDSESAILRGEKPRGMPGER
ncbi:MAG: SDR family oxidoreductase [Xanthomonadales bacterium]|nr:SDR family oxidoreductase [Xanthomonadales bacterium]